MHFVQPVTLLLLDDPLLTAIGRHAADMDDVWFLARSAPCAPGSWSSRR